MPFLLPVPPEPSMATRDEVLAVRTSADALILRAGTVRVHIVGPLPLDPGTMATAIAATATLSDVVRGIQAALSQTGHPAVTMRYALEGEDLYLLVTEAALSEIDLPVRYAGYWEGLARQQPISDRDLEPRRILASLHADRAGESVQLEWQKAESDSLLLSAPPSSAGPPRAGVTATVGNTGNRYSGRHLADLSARRSWGTGDELSLALRNSLDDEYLDGQGKWSRVIPFGVVGAGVGASRYEVALRPSVSAPPVTVEGRLDTAELSWSGILSAGFGHRWGYELRSDFIDQDVSAAESGFLPLRQRYTSVEASSLILLTNSIAGRSFEAGAGLSLGHGLGRDRSDDPGRRADFGFMSWRPQLSVRAAVSDDLELHVLASGQISGDRLPEQQQWVIGGLGNLAAYIPALAVGDQGGEVRVATATPIELASWRIQACVFTEAAWVRSESTESDEGRWRSASDVGVSLSFGHPLSPRLRMEGAVTLARPLEDRGFDRSERERAKAGVYFQGGFRY